MHLTGFEAIEYAERECLTLNKLADHIDEAATGLTIAEAEAIADSQPELIWLDVPETEYYAGPRSMEPGSMPTRPARRAGQRRDELMPGENSVPTGQDHDAALRSAADATGDDAADTIVDPQVPEDIMAEGFECPDGEVPVEPQSGHSGGAVGGTPAGKRVRPN